MGKKVEIITRQTTKRKINKQMSIDLVENAEATLVDNSDVSLRLSHWQKRKAKKMWRYSLGNDKKYRGPFSLFTLRVIAWISIICSQLAVVFTLAGDIAHMTQFNAAEQIMSILSSIAMPAFLLANFSYIIQNKGEILKLLFTYLFMMLLVAALFYTFFLHFIIGLFAEGMKIPYEAAYSGVSQVVMTVFNSTFKFNIFLDLFICTLFVYFFLGKPKHLFKGKAIILFRLLAIIPAGYEFITILFKILTVTGDFTIPFLMTPFMPTKCPLTFVCFIFIVFSEARRKRKYVKYNHSDELYDEYFKTNKNSWLFSKSVSKCFFFMGLLDCFLWAALTFLPLVPTSVPITGAIMTSLVSTLEIGESSGLMIFAPCILLFSYNKMFKPSKMDIFVPAIAIAAIIFIYMEAIYQAMCLVVFK